MTKQKKEIYLTGSLPRHSYFLDPEVQDNSRRAAFTMHNVYRDLIIQLPPDLLTWGDRNYTLASGGWSEGRLFYSENNEDDSEYRQNFWHPAIDVLLPEGHPVIAPADGKIIGVYHMDWDNIENMRGIGGNLLFVADVQDVDMPDDVRKEEFINHGADKVAMAYMHLSKDSTLDLFGTERKSFRYSKADGFEEGSTITYATNIDYNHPKYVKKGDVIGYIGSRRENTGWMPHLHLQVHKNKVNGKTPDIVDAVSWDPDTKVGHYGDNYGDYANTFMKMHDYKIVSELDVPAGVDPNYDPKDGSRERTYRDYFFHLRGKGVWSDESSIHKNGTPSTTIYDRKYFLELFADIGYVDPNKIFQYQDKTTPIFKVGDSLLKD